MAETKAGNPAVQLLQFQRKILRCNSLLEVQFVAVNETLPVLPFDQGLIWQYDLGGRVKVGAVSGLLDASEQTPYVQWLNRAINWLVANHENRVVSIPYSSVPEPLAGDGAEWMHEHLLHCRLTSPEGDPIGGLLFHRQQPFTDQERAVIEWIGDAVGFALWGWRRDVRNVRKFFRRRTTRYFALAVIAGLAMLMLVPVRMSALAPAEITPVRPIPITSPVEGVVSRIVVQPNQMVKADDVLVELDDTSIRNRLALANKAFDTAKAEFQRATNQAFTDETARAELWILESRAREKAAEVAYLSDLLARLKITTPQGGIAVFSDADEWRGRPVQPGERIMIVANPARVGITIYMPPTDAVQLEVGGEVAMFLDTAPLTPIRAAIEQTSYEATAQPDNTLAYVIRAGLPIEAGFPRIGLRGTAKVYGQTVSLGYYLLRKPIVFVRKSIGA